MMDTLGEARSRKPGPSMPLPEPPPRPAAGSRSNASVVGQVCLGVFGTVFAVVLIIVGYYLIETSTYDDNFSAVILIGVLLLYMASLVYCLFSGRRYVAIGMLASLVAVVIVPLLILGACALMIASYMNQ